MAPIDAVKLPGNCIMCKQIFESTYLIDALVAIQRLFSYCEKTGFEAVIETEEEKQK